VRPSLVRGHAGHELNERADRLAQDAAATAEATTPPMDGSGETEQMGFDIG
jgi:ribonuclease HI